MLRREVLTVRADDARVGDRVLGVHGGTAYVVEFVIGRIRDHNRGGLRLGPRFYSTDPKHVGHLNLHADTLIDIERGAPSPSRFYACDASDPDAPVLLGSYRGLRAGMAVEYVNPRAPSLPGSLIVTEIVRLAADHVTAILNDGQWEVNADNLVRLEGEDS